MEYRNTQGKNKRPAVRRSQDERVVELPSYLKPILSVARALTVFLISLCIVGVTLYFGVNSLYTSYVSPVDENDSTAVEFTIERGASLSEVSQNLEEANLVRHKGIFKYYVEFTDRTKDIKSGIYTLNRSMTMDDIIAEISRGTAAGNTMDILIIEGTTVEQMAAAIKKQMTDKRVPFNEQEFLEICKEPSESLTADYPFLATLMEQDNLEDRKYALEGYLFPAKYEIYTDSSAEAIVRKMLSATSNIFGNADFQAKFINQDMTMDEVLTLASIIEKEGTKDTFNKISAVFHNRLKADMHLSSDVTVQYITGKVSVAMTDGEISVESPYNTYKNKGLPIGPIAAPGLAAIEAAIGPDTEYVQQNYLYFTLTDPETGELAFSKTGEEHEAIVEQWRPKWIEYDQKQAEKANEN
ncbi:MAG: endolytic transglycosylase MltG [Christensenellales bacterium]|jgi:UPF0755 protein